MRSKKKAIILIMALWVIAVLLIIGVAMADMSLSSLFYIGHYIQKQQAVNLAVAGAKETIARIIDYNDFGKTGTSSLPDINTPSELQNNDYYVTFDDSAPYADKPDWLPESSVIYSYNNLGTPAMVTTNSGAREVPTDSIDIISFAKVGNTIVRVELVVSPNFPGEMPPSIATGSTGTIKINADNKIDFDSACAEAATIWSNNPTGSPSVGIYGSSVDLHDGIAGYNGTNPAGIDISPAPISGTEGYSTTPKNIPDSLDIVYLATDATAPTIPSGTFVQVSNTRYEYYDETGVMIFAVEDMVYSPSGGAYPDPAVRDSMSVDKKKLQVKRNIEVDGNMVFYDGDGLDLVNGAYIYLQNGGDTARWGTETDIYCIDPVNDIWTDEDPRTAGDFCLPGDNITEASVLSHPDYIDPRVFDASDITTFPPSPYVDKPKKGNLSMFSGSLTGDGAIYSEGSVTLNVKSSLEAEADLGVAVYSRGDINISGSGSDAKFTGLLYSHGDIEVDLPASKDLTITGAVIVTGNNTIGDFDDTGEFNVENCKKFKFTYDDSYLKALNSVVSGPDKVCFKVDSCVIK